MARNVRLRLSALMFLQYFAWGTWYVTLGTYLAEIGFSSLDIGDAYSAAAWASLISPFFLGLIADRFFHAQNILAVLHLTCAGALLWTSFHSDPESFFYSLLFTMACYMPTISLSNAVCLNQLKNPSATFPKVRVLGTIGWIMAGLLVGSLSLEKMVYPIWIGVGTSIVLGVFSFFLPKTPPRLAGRQANIREVIGFDALRLFGDRSFLIFALSSMLLTVPLAFYYNFTNLFLNDIGIVNAAGTMTIGQMSEIGFMLLMPVFFRRFRLKTVLVIGMLAWIIRYLLFAQGNLISLYIGILLHGICYDFFFLSGQIYIDRVAGEKLRSSAQGLMALITYGLGMLGGAKVSGYVVDRYYENNGYDWTQIWMWPALMAAFVVTLFMLFFNEKQKNTV